MEQGACAVTIGSSWVPVAPYHEDGSVLNRMPSFLAYVLRSLFHVADTRSTTAGTQRPPAGRKRPNPLERTLAILIQVRGARLAT